MGKLIHPPALVMNMFHTGLGIARSLGERGIPVIGLTARRGLYGNFTSYAKIHRTADSREQPEEMLTDLLTLGKQLGGKSILFPTRDDDVVFLDRYRGELQERFEPVIPARAALRTCLNKWETYGAAVNAGVASPKCWMVENQDQLEQAALEISYPCVLKPVGAHHWRKENNWKLVGARKAIPVGSTDELRAEYHNVSRANACVLLQEMIPGNDACLTIAACYMDRQGRFAGGFNTQKLLQVPEGFGTGCIVQTADHSELFQPTVRLLESMHFTGIAEVEYKWNEATHAFQLIEINPRPWDQHRLGKYAGCDLIYLAYCDHAGLTKPIYSPNSASVPSPRKWVAEYPLFFLACEMVWRRDSRLGEIRRLLSGRRIYAVWDARDPLPFLVLFIGEAIPRVVASGIRRFWSALRGIVTAHPAVGNERSV